MLRWCSDCTPSRDDALATQLHYTHGVPKTSAAVGERISLAFRVKPDRAAKAAGESGFYR